MNNDRDSSLRAARCHLRTTGVLSDIYLLALGVMGKRTFPRKSTRGNCEKAAQQGQGVILTPKPLKIFPNTPNTPDTPDTPDTPNTPQHCQ